MQKVLLLGAASQISKYLIPDLLEQTDVALTLFARHATLPSQSTRDPGGWRLE